MLGKVITVGVSLEIEVLETYRIAGVFAPDSVEVPTGVNGTVLPPCQEPPTITETYAVVHP